MKTYFFSFFVFSSVIYSLVSSGNSCKRVSSLTQKGIDPVDSFYNQLIARKIDTIFVYREIYYHEKGLIVWKESDRVHGIVYKIKAGVLTEWNNIDTVQGQLGSVISGYFNNQSSLTDSLPLSKVEALHGSKINIHSYLKGVKRNHTFHSSDAWPNRKLTLARVSLLCSDIVNDKKEKL